MMKIFITGGTGYIGKHLINELFVRNYFVSTLVRKGSESKLPGHCNIVFGDALNASTFKNEISDATVIVHLVGVAQPSPKKKEQFVSIDLASIKATIEAVNFQNSKPHLIYLSVAQTPTEIMKDYQAIRAQGELLIRQAGINATFIRPWYVIGPGHYWPLLLLPFYKLAALIPALNHRAKKLQLVYLNQIIKSLIDAIEHHAKGIRIIEIEEIRKM